MRITDEPGVRSHRDIERLAGRSEMDGVSPAFLALLDELTEKSFCFLTDADALISIEESVTIELHELPLRPARDRYVRGSPSVEARCVEALIRSESSVV